MEIKAFETTHVFPVLPNIPDLNLAIHNIGLLKEKALASILQQGVKKGLCFDHPDNVKLVWDSSRKVENVFMAGQGCIGYLTFYQDGLVLHYEFIPVA